MCKLGRGKSIGLTEGILLPAEAVDSNRSRPQLCQEGSKLNLRRQSFPVRITKVGNELPDSAVNAPNVGLHI